jgi:hypothetical protein
MHHDHATTSSPQHRDSRLRRRSAMAAAGGLVAALTVGVGTPPASASTTAMYSGHTLTITIVGPVDFSVFCEGGNVVLTAIAIPTVPCNDVQHIVANGDGADQTVSFDQVTAAGFPALINEQAVLGDGADTLFTGPKADIASLGPGGDAVYLDLDGHGDLVNLGGNVADTALFQGTDGADHLALSIAGANPSLTSDGGASASAIGAADVWVTAGGGNDTIDATAVPAATAITVSLHGDAGNDTITDGPESGQLDGGPGDDVIHGGPGTDYLVGAVGHDQVDGGSGQDLFDDALPITDHVLGGDTYTDPDPGTIWVARFQANNAALRVRPLAAGGWNVTSGLTRPGTQAVPPTFDELALETAHEPASSPHRSVVDTVLVLGERQTVDAEPGDLVDVTVSIANWQVTPNGRGGAYVSDPDITGIVDSTVSTHLFAHAPWSDAAVSFAHRSYRDLLFRYPTPMNRENLAARIRSGATTRAAVAATITGSDEYRGIEVDRVFSQFLRRTADPSGRTYWKGKLAEPISMRAFRANLLGSSEYYRNFGFNSPTGFVTALYADLLNRAPDSGGLAHWVAQLNGGTSRASVANSFLSSSEARTEIVTTQFLRLANRVPTSSEISLWSDRLLNVRTGETDLVAFLLASNAYFNRVN